MGKEETDIRHSSNSSSKGQTSELTRIMLVDDEPDINAALKVVLSRAGFDVDTFEDPTYALGMIKPGMYDLVILDLKMPKMDGFELYQEIKKIDEDVKICFLTASELFYERLREKEYAMLDKSLFIRKPISNADLLKKVNLILDKGNYTSSSEIKQ